MSDLKFSCPSCGQHIKCDESYAGAQLPCPGCAAQIQVPVEPALPSPAMEPLFPPPPVASPGLGIGAVPTLEENFLAESGTPLPTAPPLTERERQLAAARAAHPMAPNPHVKPRLSFILSGGAAPAQEENESAMHSVEQKHSENHSPENALNK